MTTFNLPDLGEGLQEAEILAWHVNPGDRIKLDQPMVSVETAKAVIEVPSPYTGVVKTLHAKAGDIVGTGRPLVDFELDGAPVSATNGTGAPPAAKKADPNKADDSGTVVGNMPTSDAELVETAIAGGARNTTVERVRAAPAVRALAKRLGVDLTRLQGSGRGGLITIDDVLAPNAVSGPATARPATPPAPISGAAEPLRGLRRGMAHSMSQSRDAVATCTLFDDADLHHWIRKGDYTVRVIRAMAAACRAEPALNAHFDSDSVTRTLHTRVDIAIAVDTPEGLIVPVIRDAGNRSAEQLRADLGTLKSNARARTVAPEDLRDFTILLSNFGTIAGRYATPLVVPPAVAILGTGGLRDDVVAVMGDIEAHQRLPLSLTFDHRCVTGGEAARFLAAVIKDLELPV